MYGRRPTPTIARGRIAERAIVAFQHLQAAALFADLGRRAETEPPQHRDRRAPALQRVLQQKPGDPPVVHEEVIDQRRQREARQRDRRGVRLCPLDVPFAIEFGEPPGYFAAARRVIAQAIANLGAPCLVYCRIRALRSTRSVVAGSILTSGLRSCATTIRRANRCPPARTARDQMPRGSAPAGEPQKGRGAAGGAGFVLVAGRRPVGGALAPVGGTARQPCESRMRGRVLQHPDKIIAVVGREPQFRARPHQNRQSVQRRGRDQPALVVA